MTTSFRCSYAVVSRKARFSSWETYEGVAIGGFTGEVATLYVRPIGDGAIIAGGSTLVGHSLENLTGKESRSTGEVLLNTGRDSVIGVASGILSLKIGGINTGRNSFDSIYKSGLAKIGNGTASRISESVFTK